MSGSQRSSRTPRTTQRLDSGEGIGVRTRAQRAALGDVLTPRPAPMTPDPDDSTSSGSDSASGSGSDSRTAKSAATTRGRGRACQGGHDFADLVLPPADLEKLRKRWKKREPTKQKSQSGTSARLTEARTALMLSALPKTLLCRDEEKQQIQSTLEDFFSQRTGRSMYICGVPGTGKTATTLEIIQQYRHRPDTQFVLLNCLSMASANDLYSALHASLLGKDIGQSAAMANLAQYFRETATLTVLILDEMDILLTKRSRELYNLFEWCWEGGRLCILGISNTVDLPQRLPTAIQKRMGTQALIFKPYSKTQMESIVKDRLKKWNVFHDVAIQRAAAKVAHTNGDVRRCLQLLQLSIDMFQRSVADPKSKITAHHVGEAIAEMFGDEILADLDLVEKLLLSGFLFAARGAQQRLHTFSAEEILQRSRDASRLAEISLPSDGFLLKALAELHVAGIIAVEDGQKRLFERSALCVSENDVTAILAQEERLERVTASLRL